MAAIRNMGYYRYYCCCHNFASSSSFRSFGPFLRRFSTNEGVSSKASNSFHFQRTGLLRRHLSISSSPQQPCLYASRRSFKSIPNPVYGAAVRTITTFAPLFMGRRSCKIAGRKEAQNRKKGKIHSKIGKQVVSAVKKGGPNPMSNTVLAAVLEKAKELDVPREILERNIKRASEKGQEAYVEKFYEVYGFGGVGMVVEALTDKITRSVATIRDVVKECGGKMADPGSILFKFKRARVVNIKVTDADKDQLLAIALDAGAEDVIEPLVDEDSTDLEKSECYYKVVCSGENYTDILSKLREEAIKFETDNGMELLPVTLVEVDDEAMDLNKELISKLLELEDVDAVYTDQK